MNMYSYIHYIKYAKLVSMILNSENQTHLIIKKKYITIINTSIPKKNVMQDRNKETKCISLMLMSESLQILPLSVWEKKLLTRNQSYDNFKVIMVIVEKTKY